LHFLTNMTYALSRDMSRDIHTTHSRRIKCHVAWHVESEVETYLHWSLSLWTCAFCFECCHINRIPSDRWRPDSVLYVTTYVDGVQCVNSVNIEIADEPQAHVSFLVVMDTIPTCLSNSSLTSLRCVCVCVCVCVWLCVWARNELFFSLWNLSFLSMCFVDSHLDLVIFCVVSSLWQRWRGSKLQCTLEAWNTVINLDKRHHHITSHHITSRSPL